MKAIASFLIVAVLAGGSFTGFRHYRMMSGEFKHKADIALDSIDRLGNKLDSVRWLDAQKAVAEAGYSVSTVPDRDMNDRLKALLKASRTYLQDDAMWSYVINSAGSLEEIRAVNADSGKYSAQLVKDAALVSACSRSIASDLGRPNVKLKVDDHSVCLTRNR